MSNPNIYIKGVGADGKLILSDNGKTKVNSKSDFRKVTWSIADLTQTVVSFKLKAITSSEYPFTKPIPGNFDDIVTLKVNKDEPFLDWEYCIIWKDRDGHEHSNDPIISIRPSAVSEEFLEKSIIGIVLMGLGFIAASLLFWKLRKK